MACVWTHKTQPRYLTHNAQQHAHSACRSRLSRYTAQCTLHTHVAHEAAMYGTPYVMPHTHCHATHPLSQAGQIQVLGYWPVGLATKAEQVKCKQELNMRHRHLQLPCQCLHHISSHTHAVAMCNGKEQHVHSYCTMPTPQHTIIYRLPSKTTDRRTSPAGRQYAAQLQL